MSKHRINVSRSPILGIPMVTHRVLEDDRGPFGIPIEPALVGLGLIWAGPLGQLNYSKRAQGCTFGVHVSNTGKYCFVLPDTTYQTFVVDLRDPQMITFGTVEEFRLVAGQAIYVPAGYGNAGQAVTKDAFYLYALDGVFDPTQERKVSLLDTRLNLPWHQKPWGLSKADATAMSLNEYADNLSSR